MSENTGSYYVPEYSKLPFFTALGLFCLGFGILKLFEIGWMGPTSFVLGAIILSSVLFGWFRETIHESRAGLHDAKMTASYRWGMFWFIFSDLFLFGIFLVAYLYIRFVTIPDLGGVTGHANSTLGHLLLWPDFKSAWPLLVNPNPTAFPAARGSLNAWGVPVLSTISILVSALASHWSLMALKHKKINQVLWELFGAILFGMVFVILQFASMILLYDVLGVSLHSGIYGSLLFMIYGIMTGQAIVGVFMLFVIWFRAIRGHFQGSDHFAIDAVIWFWQFITFIWLLVFLLLYII